MVGEVALSGAHYAIGPAAHAALPDTDGDAPSEPMPRWIPVAVIGGALAIGVAAAIGITQVGAPASADPTRRGQSSRSTTRNCERNAPS